MSNHNMAELLAKTPLFSGLPHEVVAGVGQAMRPVRFEPAQLIFSRGDPGAEMYLVITGRVKISILTAEGRELSFAHIGPGGLFGEIAMLDSGPRTADATALTVTEAMSLSAGSLRRLLDHSSDLAEALIRFLCQRLRETDMQLEGVALHRIEVRLARYLIALCQQISPNLQDDVVSVEIGTSQGELALLLGASRPKVNGALILLEDQGAIERDGHRVRCNLEFLQDIAGLD